MGLFETTMKTSKKLPVIAKEISVAVSRNGMVPAQAAGVENAKGWK